MSQSTGQTFLHQVLGVLAGTTEDHLYIQHEASTKLHEFSEIRLGWKVCCVVCT
jgi:hypothetical protein